jgi:hypothetical protein
MPEHIHVLMARWRKALHSLKQGVARRLARRAKGPFWQARHYDFNVWSEMKFVEKLRYIATTPQARPGWWRSSHGGRQPGGSGQEYFLRSRVRLPAAPPAQAKLDRDSTLES